MPIQSDKNYNRNVVLLGVRGSSALKDWLVDAEIGLQKNQAAI